MLRHVVLFKFKENATADQVKVIETKFASLSQQLDLIQAFEYGTNISKENLDQGFTHCFIVTFKSEADLETYLPHPAHQAFVADLQPVLEEALVIDFLV